MQLKHVQFVPFDGWRVMTGTFSICRMHIRLPETGVVAGLYKRYFLKTSKVGNLLSNSQKINSCYNPIVAFSD